MIFLCLLSVLLASSWGFADIKHAWYWKRQQSREVKRLFSVTRRWRFRSLSMIIANRAQRHASVDGDQLNCILLLDILKQDIPSLNCTFYLSWYISDQVMLFIRRESLFPQIKNAKDPRVILISFLCVEGALATFDNIWIHLSKLSCERNKVKCLFARLVNVGSLKRHFLSVFIKSTRLVNTSEMTLTLHAKTYKNQCDICCFRLWGYSCWVEIIVHVDLVIVSDEGLER